MTRFVKAVCIFIVALLYISAENCNGFTMHSKRAAKLPKLAILAKKFSPLERRLTYQEIETSYKKIDENDDGQITVEELGRFIKETAEKTLSVNQLKEIISELDSSGNGRVEFAEYRNHLIRLNSISDYVGRTFDSFDLNGDGYITSYELQRALKRLEGTLFSMKEVRALIAEADLNNDGKLNIIELDELAKKHS